MALAVTSVAVAGCGGGHRQPSGHRTRPRSAALSVVAVAAPAKLGCRFKSVFEALAETNGATVVCPTWLPHGLRARALTLGNSGQVSSGQISLSGPHWLVMAGAAPSPSPPGTLIEHATLSGGPRILLHATGRRFVIDAHIPQGAGQQVLGITLIPSHLSHAVALASAKRLVASLRVLPSDIIGRRASCQYPAVFAAVASVAGASTALCPRWLPASVTLDLASAGPLDEYNPVEFHSDVGNGIFPHIVFEWVAHRPPGRPLLSITLHSGRRVPVYFQAPGIALNSDHLIANVGASSKGRRFWVTLHDSYGSRHATESVLRRIVNSLRPLDPQSASPRR